MIHLFTHVYLTSSTSEPWLNFLWLMKKANCMIYCTYDCTTEQPDGPEIRNQPVHDLRHKYFYVHWLMVDGWRNYLKKFRMIPPRLLHTVVWTTPFAWAERRQKLQMSVLYSSDHGSTIRRRQTSYGTWRRTDDTHCKESTPPTSMWRWLSVVMELVRCRLAWSSCLMSLVISFTCKHSPEVNCGQQVY